MPEITFLDAVTVTPEIQAESMRIAEDYFGTSDDPDQIRVSDESMAKLRALHPASVLCRVEGGHPVSWVVTVPTSRELANQFLEGRITEAELLERSQPQEMYDAVYLCASFTVPEYRGRGYALDLRKRVLAAIPQTKDALLFSWPFSEEGKGLLKRLSQELNRPILLREDAPLQN